jgi:hypothetical protein
VRDDQAGGLLVINRDWLAPDFQPATLTDSPLGEALPATPAWGTMAEVTEHEPWDGSLESFAAALVGVLELELAGIATPVHLAVSGGYDSRLLLALCERLGLDPLCCGDGTQEPVASKTMDYLNIHDARRYVHDLEQDDPYGVSSADIPGWAPLYFGMSFFSPDPAATLITGLGGGEWFSYPAAGWHNGHKARTPRATLVDWWLDTWPQYWLIPRSWAAGYARAFHPYCTPQYAAVATRCRPEWLVETKPELELDAVREAMLCVIDPDLTTLGYAPHRYDWRLSADEKDAIDERFHDSWLARSCREETVHLRPSRMHDDVHACTLAGFATWCDALIAEGHSLQI